MNTQLKSWFRAAVVTAAVVITGSAAAVGPRPAPLPAPVTLTVGYQKVGHLVPMVQIADELKKMNVEIKLVEFARYADARTAMLAGSLDVASVGPADLAIALSQGSKAMVGIMGVGSSLKYVIARNGTKFDSWADVAGKKIGIAPGSAVWFQWAMTLVENGDQVTELLHKTIDKIPGVHRVQYSLGQQFVKHDYHWSVIQPQPAV